MSTRPPSLTGPPGSPSNARERALCPARAQPWLVRGCRLQRLPWTLAPALPLGPPLRRPP